MIDGATVTKVKIKAYFGTTLTTRKKLISKTQAVKQIVVVDTAVVADTAVMVETATMAEMANAAVAAVAATTTRGETDTIEGEPATVAVENDVLCHTLEMAAVKEIRNLHAEELLCTTKKTFLTYRSLSTKLNMVLLTSRGKLAHCTMHLTLHSFSPKLCSATIDLKTQCTAL